MEASTKAYDFEASRRRLDDILALPAGSFEEVNSLPPRNKLTFSNGYYANCAAIFIDIRRSSELPSKYQRPQLARIYRAFISEMVALFTSHSEAREVNIVGDCVWAVVNSPSTGDIAELFSIAAKANSLVQVLNHKLSKKGYTHRIDVGIGLDYGRALMIKAGYAGSGINDVVYMGDVVNHAAKLASEGDSAKWGGNIFLSENIHTNLSTEDKGFCSSVRWGTYRASVVNSIMSEWLEAQK